jgi:hypothetical protein
MAWRGNSTSTTAPMHWTILPWVWVFDMSMVLQTVSVAAAGFNRKSRRRR